MRSTLLALLAGATTTTAPHAAPHDAAAHAPATAAHGPAAAAPARSAVNARPAALPPYAAALAQSPMITGAAGWHGEAGPKIWEQLATATPVTRQATRWSYVLGLIAEHRGADALGVLDVMRSGDQDLALVAHWQLARGAALALVQRDAEAVAVLAGPDLAGNPEACAWRLRALSHAGAAAQALREVNCAVPAINGRAPAERKPFVLAAATAALDAGRPAPVLGWLKLFNDQDPVANVLRGRAMIAAGDLAGGKLRLERAQHSGGAEVIANARLAVIEMGVGTHSLAGPAAIHQIGALRYRWRGGPVERRALQLEYKLATDAQDMRAQLRAGATLFRYFKLGSDAAPMLATLQGSLRTALDPASKLSLPDAAGVYWDYRELAPAGAEGDLLALNLANRLQSAGLYARAAELLQYQLNQRAQDVAQGPLSVKVAALHILAGRPDRALKALQETEQPSFTAEMRFDRKRMEAVALHQLGRDAAAMAALDDVPGAASVRAEINWRAKNWGAFVTENEATLPAPKGLGEPAQAAVLRQAVGLAMTGNEPKLAALRARYGAAFKSLPSGQAFDVLTSKPGSVDPASVAAAMGAIPEASPAGAIGDLLDVNG